MISDPEIQRCLVVSTAHITGDDSFQLHEMSEESVLPRPLIVFSKGEYGWWISVDLDQEQPPLPTMSEAFSNLLAEARRLKVEWLVLDRDGIEYPELPTFDW
jgi:hypothetical protein